MLYRPTTRTGPPCWRRSFLKPRRNVRIKIVVERRGEGHRGEDDGEVRHAVVVHHKNVRRHAPPRRRRRRRPARRPAPLRPHLFVGGGARRASPSATASRRTRASSSRPRARAATPCRCSRVSPRPRLKCSFQLVAPGARGPAARPGRAMSTGGAWDSPGSPRSVLRGAGPAGISEPAPGPDREPIPVWDRGARPASGSTVDTRSAHDGQRKRPGCPGAGARGAGSLLAARRGGLPRGHVLALDGSGVVVRPSSPRDSLSKNARAMTLRAPLRAPTGVAYTSGTHAACGYWSKSRGDDPLESNDIYRVCSQCPAGSVVPVTAPTRRTRARSGISQAAGLSVGGCAMTRHPSSSGC